MRRLLRELSADPFAPYLVCGMAIAIPAGLLIGWASDDALWRVFAAKFDCEIVGTRAYPPEVNWRCANGETYWRRED